MRDKLIKLLGGYTMVEYDMAINVERELRLEERANLILQRSELMGRNSDLSELLIHLTEEKDKLTTQRNESQQELKPIPQTVMPWRQRQANLEKLHRVKQEN